MKETKLVIKNVFDVRTVISITFFITVAARVFKRASLTAATLI